MDISIFLAKALGIYCGILALVILKNPKGMMQVLKDMEMQPAFQFVMGILALIFGILMVLAHNVWEMAWPVAVTVVGWLAIGKGVMRLMYPKLSVRLIHRWVDHDGLRVFMIALIIAMALFFLYYGFR